MRLFDCSVALFSLLLLLHTSILALARTQPESGTGQSVFDTLSEQVEKIWEGVSGFGDEARNLAFSHLEEASQTFADVKPQIKELQASLEKIARSVEEFKNKHVKDVNFDEVSTVLTKELDKVFQSLRVLPDEEPNSDERRRRVEEFLRKIEAELIRVLVKFGVPREKVQELIDTIHPHLVSVIVMIGDFRESHPVLFDVIVIAVSTYAFSKLSGPILRVILKMIGFGPTGPMKGSAAAAAQRFFFGGAVSSGSWFAFLQEAGMTGAKNLKGLIDLAASGGMASNLLRRVVVDP